MFSKEDKAFASEFLDRVVKKVTAMAPEIGANFPTTNSRIGEWDPKGTTANISSWTTAFWPGMMWLMYLKTGDKMFREYAEGCEAKLDEAFDIFTGIHHDVGFMWSLSAVADYKITGNEKSKARAMHAATVLAGRFNHVAKYIRAWDHSSHRWAIIDCMMNIPLLSFATSIQDDPRFEQVARAHADTVAKSFIRGDGSSNHVVEFDPETGDVLATPRGQGYESGSSWSRGQAWALYGFAMSYHYTKDEKHLHILTSASRNISTPQRRLHITLLQISKTESFRSLTSAPPKSRYTTIPLPLLLQLAVLLKFQERFRSMKQRFMSVQR